METYCKEQVFGAGLITTQPLLKFAGAFKSAQIYSPLLPCALKRWWLLQNAPVNPHHELSSEFNT